ncbi:Hypothetical protein DHA2_30448 [Giardia duodenalis]|uniref:Sugar phosphate transporter domain-containing protein n=1 Tax=Giardia intestinalis TaxID=5741 RepID=V6T9B3_GIAIN|nr:Hypothetical protein DHA2_30448 [Giardia intestinalis]
MVGTKNRCLMSRKSPSTAQKSTLKHRHPLKLKSLPRWLSILLVVIYVVTGIFQPIVLDLISRMGGAEKQAFLFPIPNSMGMALLMAIPTRKSHYSRRASLYKFPKEIIVMTLIDVSATTLTLFGQLMIGSGLYIIVYSSLTIWSAIGSLLLLKRHFTWPMWMGVVVVTIGLMISGVGAFTTFGLSTLIGMAVTLVGTILHSGVYWVSEYFCLHKEYPIHSTFLAGYMGIFGVAIFLSYVTGYTIPRWEALFVQPMEAGGGSYWKILSTYLLLILIDWAHLYAQFTAVVAVGSVIVGINKAISSIGVFVLSHFLFCEVDSSECIDLFKILSLCFVISGVIIYTTAYHYYKKKQNRLQGSQKSPQEDTLIDQLPSSETPPLSLE